MITKEQHNHLVSVFANRSKANGYKGKTQLKMQQEFFLGAIALLDQNKKDGEGSEISPMIYFAILRGDLIKPIE